MLSIDLHRLLVVFLAAVSASPEIVEIGVFEEGGESQYLVLEDGKWQDYRSGAAQDFVLMKSPDDAEDTTYKGIARVGGNEITLTREFEIPDELFDAASGTFLVRRDDETIVVKKFEEGIEFDFPLPRADMHVRWKKQK